MNCRRIMSALVPGVLCALSLAAAAAPPGDIVKARQKFFGIENVDGNGNVKGDKVIFSWATNTTYVVSIEGRVILLDSYINRPELPTTPIDHRRSPVLPQDFVDVQPEAIFLGHGHGDHADNAAFVAKWLGIPIYSSPETCDVMQLDVTRMFNDPNAVNGGAKIVPDGNPVNCIGVVPRGSRPGEYDEKTDTSTARRIDALGPQVCILAFKFLHSNTAPVDPTFAHTPLANLGDPRYAGVTIGTTVYPAMFPTGTSFTPGASPVAGQMNTTTSGFGSPPGIPAGAIEIVYQFVLRSGNKFAFFWANSAGPATEGITSQITVDGQPAPLDKDMVTLAQYTNPATDPAKIALAKKIGASLYALMDTLPSTDVLLGSIVSLGAANNQQRDIIKVTQHLKPKVYYPGHLTDVAQAGSALYHKIDWRETANNMGFPQSEWPEFRLQIDPNDFFVPQVFDPNDKRWSKSDRSVPDLCRGK
jgi:L-ascorbate metabolism protein UlaG (beta-lactamase superfamily)